MRQNRKMFIRSLLAVIALFIIVGVGLPEARRGREPEFFEAEADRDLPKPVIIRLSQIPQRQPEHRFEEEPILNAGEREFHKMVISNDQQTEHFFQQDQSVLKLTQVPAPSLQGSFGGIPCTGRAQPDSIIAVGPTRVLLAVNGGLAIYTKSGQKRFETSLDSWFASLTSVAGAVPFDPRLLYDQYDGHYIFTCTTRRRDHRSWILLSVSKTSDPEGEWAFWALDMQMNGASRVDLWADFPRLGIDKNAIYLTADMSTFGTFLFDYAKLKILRKNQVYRFGAIASHDYWKMNDASGKYAVHLEPAHSFGTTDAEYLLNTRNDSANQITLWKLTNPTTRKRQLTNIGVRVRHYNPPPLAQQKGDGTVLVASTEGTGVLKVISRDGSIYASHAIAHNWGSGLVSAIRFYQLSTAGKMIQQITYGSDGVSYYMPTVMANGAGDVFLAFNRSSKTQFAGIYYAGRKAADPRGKLSRSVTLQQGLGNYAVPFAHSNIDHWGDYNGIALDPDDSVWIYGEYAINSDTWGTQFGKIAY